jgi:hypothetical protein
VTGSFVTGSFVTERQHVTGSLEANPIVGIKPCDNAAFAVQPQGYGKDTNGKSIGRTGRATADLASVS